MVQRVVVGAVGEGVVDFVIQVAIFAEVKDLTQGVGVGDTLKTFKKLGVVSVGHEKVNWIGLDGIFAST